jgi:hypothetical protein
MDIIYLQRNFKKSWGTEEDTFLRNNTMPSQELPLQFNQDTIKIYPLN